MATTRPEGEKCISDRRVTVIAAVKHLANHFVDPYAGGGLVDQVKSAMRAKDAAYAESDLAIARLSGGSGRKEIDAADLYKLVITEAITIEEFLELVSVRLSATEKFLGTSVTGPITRTRPNELSLTTEFKPGVVIDPVRLADALVNSLAKIAA